MPGVGVHRVGLHGGYAEYMAVADAFAHPLPSGFSDAELAPLLCAGIIGYRALRRAQVPPGGTLGIWGFGGSAHLAAQVAMGQGAEVHVFTRAQAARELALSLGAASAQDSFDPTPVPLDSAIMFAPVGDLVPAALAALDRGGTCAIAGHLPDRYPAAQLRQAPVPGATLRSVTSNTRGDAAEFLTLASGWDQGHHHALPLRPGRPGAGRPGRRPDPRGWRIGPVCRGTSR